MPTSCFICGFSHLPPPNPNISNSTKSSPSSVLAALMNDQEKSKFMSIATRLAEVSFCVACAEELTRILSVIEELERLNLEIEEARKTVAGRLRESCEKFEDLKELRWEICRGLQEDIDPLQLLSGEVDIKTEPELYDDFDSEVADFELGEQVPYIPYLPGEEEPKSKPLPMLGKSKRKRIKRKKYGWSTAKRKNKPKSQPQTPPTPTRTIPLNLLMQKSSKIIQNKNSAVQTSKEATNLNPSLISSVFVCKRCDSVFSTMVSYTYHRRHACRPPAKTKVSCKVCSQKITKTELGRHMRQSHPDTAFGRGVCNICNKSSIDLEYHHATTHQTEFKCSQCLAEFTKYIEYNYHLTTHPELGLLPVKCPECGKLFMQNKNLEGHVKFVHHKEHPFKCNLCPSGFRTAAYLNEHIRTVHERIRPFACSICDGRFSSDSYLRQHLLRHKGEVVKNYACQFCPRKFNGGGKLKDHVAAVHGGERNHICDICGQAFPIYNYLYVHLRSHESKEEKDARRERARLAREERKAKQNVLVAKGRPRVRNQEDQTHETLMMVDNLINSNISPGLCKCSQIHFHDLLRIY